MSEVGNVLSIPRALRLFQRKRVRALCDSADALGNCAYISGDLSAEKYQIRSADPTDSAKMPAIGVIIEKPSATECVLQVIGEIPDTLYSGLTPGGQLYVGLDSKLTHTPPHGSYVQHAGEAFGAEEPFFWPFAEVQGVTTGQYLTNRPLAGALDKANRVFTTLESFLPDTFTLTHNGRRLERAGIPMPSSGDYHLSESGGAGSGFDTVTILRFSPSSRSKLYADYVSA